MAGNDARTLLRRSLSAFVVVIGILCLARVVVGSNAVVGLNGTRESVSVPQWLYLLTGGAVIGASGLLASIVTDRTFIRAIHTWHRVVPTRESLRAWAVRGGRLVGLLVLFLSIYLGFTGPQIRTANFTFVLVFAGVRAGLTIVAYLLGNPWPLLNPWRTITESIPVSRILEYPERFGVWPAVIGLLAFVFVETATPVTAVPRVLTLAIVVYTVYTVAGGIVFGSEDWFRFCDPLAVAFRFYGKVAPLRWTDAGLECRLPGAVLAETETVNTPNVAFAIALIWELTFSGFINTQLGTGFIDVLVGPIPRFLVEFVFFVVGYVVFLGAYWLAARLTRNRIETYLTAEAIGAWMAPALLAIAAGYHLAHYFWLFFRNIPSLALLFASPFSPPANPLVFAVPAWSNDLNIAFILLGHLLAVWVAHARAYSLFPSRLQAIRSQFPFIAVMIGYTVASLWVISLV